MADGGGIKKVVMTMLVVIIALSLVGVITSNVTTAVSSGSGYGNLTGADFHLAIP